MKFKISLKTRKGRLLLLGGVSVLAIAATGISVPLVLTISNATSPTSSNEDSLSVDQLELRAFMKKYPDTIDLSDEKVAVKADAFVGRTDLPTDFKLPVLVTEVGPSAFKNAGLPFGFKIGPNLQSIDPTAFSDAVIGEDYYWNTGTPEVGAKIDVLANYPAWKTFNEEYPKALDKRNVSPNAFQSKADLPADFTLPNGIDSIGAFAFADAQLPSDFALPASVSNLGQNAFEDVVFPEDFALPARLTSIGLPRQGETAPANETPFYNAVFEEGFTLPSTVEQLAVDAFSGVTMTPGFAIPASTQLMKAGANGSWTTSPDLALEDEVLAEGWQWNGTKGGVSGTSIVPTEAAKAALANFLATYPDQASRLGERGVINSDAFSNQTSLPADFAVPSLVKVIGANAFSNTPIDLGFQIPRFANRMDPTAFSQSILADDVLWDTSKPLPGSKADVIPNNVDYKEFTAKYQKSLEGTKVASYAFEKRALPADFALPFFVKTIGASAFFQAQLPLNFVLPSGVTHLDDRAFAETTLPNNFVLPTNVAFIGFNSETDSTQQKVFYGSTLTAGFRIGNEAPKIGYTAFDSATVALGFEIPQNAKIYTLDANNNWVYDADNQLTGINLPANCTWSDTSGAVAGSKVILKAVA